METCNNCSAEIYLGDKFCPMCGHEISISKELGTEFANSTAVSAVPADRKSSVNDFYEKKQNDRQFAMKVQKCANDQELDELLKNEGFSFSSSELKMKNEEIMLHHEEEVDLKEPLKKELRGWGIGLIIMGFIHLIMAGFLNPVWGVIIIIVGILNLSVINPYILIVNGAALIIVGLMNIINTLGYGFSGWLIFGCLQIFWGIMEIIKYEKYSSQGKK